LLLQSPRSHGFQCLPLGLFSHRRRSGRSAQGSSLKLPERRGVFAPNFRRRCLRLQQFRNTRDIVPPFWNRCGQYVCIQSWIPAFAGMTKSVGST
jgi:hypothetical protein